MIPTQSLPKAHSEPMMRAACENIAMMSLVYTKKRILEKRRLSRPRFFAP